MSTNIVRLSGLQSANKLKGLLVLLLLLSYCGSAIAVLEHLALIEVNSRWISLLFDNVTGWFTLSAGYLLLFSYAFSSYFAVSKLSKIVALLVVTFSAVYQAISRFLQIPQTFGDFYAYFQGAQALAHGQNPYQVRGAVAFPFPSFPLYYLISLGGRLDITDAYAAFWGFNLILWVATCVLAWKITCHVTRWQRMLAIYVVLASSAYGSIAHGQTSILLALLVTTLIWTSRFSSGAHVLAGGIILGVLVLVKPYFALLVFFVGIYAWARRERAAWQMGIVSGLTVGCLIIISLVTNLVNIQVYVWFWEQALPKLANPAQMYQTAFNGYQGNSSPVAMVATFIASGNTFNEVSTIFSVIGVIALTWLTIKTLRSFPHITLSQYILAVVVPCLLIPKVLYSGYTSWILLSCLALIPFLNDRDQWLSRSLVFVSAYGFLQIDNPYGNMVAVSIISVLVWRGLSSNKLMVRNI